MSYAQVTAENREPLSQQPHPDLALLNTTPPTSAIPNGTGSSDKVAVASAAYKELTNVSNQNHSMESGQVS